MINCLTVSQYRDLSEEGQKALELIASLENEKNILNKNEYVSFSEDGKDYELTDNTRFEIDICIQHMLNEKFVRTGFKDVGIFEPITKNQIEYNNFLNFMDTIIVRSSHQKNILPEHLKNKTQVVRPVYSFPSKRDSTKRIISTFIFSCQMTDKIDDILTAYFNSFTVNDNVCLAVLSNPEQLIKKIDEVKANLDLYNGQEFYPEIKIVNNLDTLLSISHCCVEVSGTYNIKNFCISSLKYGNPIITLKNNPVLEWIGDDCYYIVDSHEDFVRSNQTCEFAHKLSLGKEMRRVVFNRAEFLEKQGAIMDEHFKAFDYLKQGSIGEVLCSL